VITVDRRAVVRWATVLVLGALLVLGMRACGSYLDVEDLPGPRGALRIEILGLRPGEGPFRVDFQPELGPKGPFAVQETGYTFSQVAVGEYTVIVRQGDRRATAQAIVREGKRTGVKVRLP